MRILQTLLLFSLTATVVAAEEFPLTATVVSYSIETAPETGGVVKTETAPALRQQFPNAPASSTRRVQPLSYVETKVEIGARIYTLRGGKILEPGQYPASIENQTVHLQVPDKNGKTKTLKLHVFGIATKVP